MAAGHVVPAVIKIDIEGFEGEVFDGMASVLDLPSLRAVCVEVHFRALNERGKPHEPARLVQLVESISLRSNGLMHSILSLSDKVSGFMTIASTFNASVARITWRSFA